MFESILQSGNPVSTNFFIILLVSLVGGALFAFLSCFGSKSSKGFGIAVGMLPMAVAVVILLVNGNLGVGVAIAGAFGLVRFRSAPGSAKEIAQIFISMAAGLALGMGYIAYAVIFLVLCGIILFVFERTPFSKDSKPTEKIVKIVIPESLDYTGVFDEIFAKYTKKSELEQVKTINMGSMFRLTYRVELKDKSVEKEMIDEIRIRNGNLEVLCSKVETSVLDL